MTFLIILFALLLDQVIGEVKTWHPLVGFGLLANKAEKFLRQSSKTIIQQRQQRARGIIALLLITLPFVFLTYEIINQVPPALAFFLNLIILYFAIGAKSLKQHAQNIYRPLINNKIEDAKKQTQYIVSRDTKNMSENDISKAAIESVLENGNDAIFGVLFWFIIAGAPGAILFRLVNTLDAMWGYRNERFLHFGWAAAKTDDAMNYVPARLTALSYACLGQFKNAITCWRAQAPLWDSPNAGPVMASGAGALLIKLGGKATYHNKVHTRPTLGSHHAAKANDINKAIKLVDHSIVLWLVVILFFTAIIGVMSRA